MPFLRPCVVEENQKIRGEFERNRNGTVTALYGIVEDGQRRRFPKTEEVQPETDSSDPEKSLEINEKICEELGIHFVRVTGDTFRMGDVFGDAESKKRPVHLVRLNDFEMSTTEITFTQYDYFCERTGYEKPDDAGWGREERPVIYVSWAEAEAFCQWLSGVSTMNIRLPTEAEWEYAAREGGKKVRFANSQNTADPDKINFDGSEEHKKSYSLVGENRQKTLPVASFSPNELGLYDMAGNVWEWCADWYDDEYYKNSPIVDPTGADAGIYRCIRGGSWDDGPAWLRCSTRGAYTPTAPTNFIGFRIARTPLK